MPSDLDQFGMPLRGGDKAAPRRRSRAMSPPVEHSREADSEDQKTEAFRQNVIFGMFVAMIIGMTLFEKIGVGPADAPVALIVPITFAALGAGILFAKPLIRFERMLLYFAVVVTSALSNVLFANTFSVTSLLLYFVLYLPFLVAFDTTEATYRRCLSFFSTAMLVFGAVVWAQHAIQFSIGWRYWPNLDKLVPPAFLIPQFVYIQPIRYGMDFMKPQGIVFLEVSFVSQFLAFALIIELLFLQRMWRAAFFATTLFATFAGTGMLLVLAALPIIFTKTNTRTFVIILITAAIALFVAFQLHWFDLVADRLGEFQRAGSSGSSRFIDPLDRIRRALADPNAIYSGVGAGQIERAMNIFWWPIVKATVEYGLIQGILFYVFFIVSLFDRAPSRQLSMILILWFSFEGTLLTPLNPIMCVMLSTMFVIRDQRSSRRSGRPRDTVALA